MAQHILIIDDGNGRRAVELSKEIYSIGRDEQCDIHLNSLFVSRHHATLIQLTNEDGNSFYRIVDGTPEGRRSANGMMFNGRKILSHDLLNGDEVNFGPMVFLIYSNGSDASGNDSPYWGSPSPRNPYPLIPTVEAEALPDE